MNPENLEKLTFKCRIMNVEKKKHLKIKKTFKNRAKKAGKKQEKSRKKAGKKQEKHFLNNQKRDFRNQRRASIACDKI